MYKIPITGLSKMFKQDEALFKVAREQAVVEAAKAVMPVINSILATKRPPNDVTTLMQVRDLEAHSTVLYDEALRLPLLFLTTLGAVKTTIQFQAADWRTQAFKMASRVMRQMRVDRNTAEMYWERYVRVIEYLQLAPPQLTRALQVSQTKFMQVAGDTLLKRLARHR